MFEKNNDVKKRLWNMKVTMVAVVVGALQTVSKDLERRLRKLKISEKIKTIQSTALLKSARIFRSVLEI